MKKFLAIVLAITLTLSMTACGGSELVSSEKGKSSATVSIASSKPDLENPEYTPEQLVVAKKFVAMTDKIQLLADIVNADENLLAVQELVNTMNTMIGAVNEDDALLAEPQTLTPEVLKNLEEGIVVGNDFIKEMEAMIEHYQGKNTITLAVEILNDTGIDIRSLAMSPTNNSEWGSDLLEAPLATGTRGVSEMTFTEDTLIWDLLAVDSDGTDITFMGINFTEAPMEGAKLVLSTTGSGNYVAVFA